LNCLEYIFNSSYERTVSPELYKSRLAKII